MVNEIEEPELAGSALQARLGEELGEQLFSCSKKRAGIPTLEARKGLEFQPWGQEIDGFLSQEHEKGWNSAVGVRKWCISASRSKKRVEFCLWRQKRGWISISGSKKMVEFWSGNKKRAGIPPLGARKGWNSAVRSKKKTGFLLCDHRDQQSPRNPEAASPWAQRGVGRVCFPPGKSSKSPPETDGKPSGLGTSASPAGKNHSLG